MKVFSKKLKELRIEKQLSLNEWSKIIGFAKSTVTEWETKENEPNYDTLIKISKFFNVSVDYLLGLEDFE